MAAPSLKLEQRLLAPEQRQKMRRHMNPPVMAVSMELQMVLTQEDLRVARQWLLLGERAEDYDGDIRAASAELMFRRQYVTDDTDLQAPRYKRSARNAVLFV